MLKFIILIFVIIINCTLSQKNFKLTNLDLVGGKNSNITTIPYHVSIELDNEHWCSGIIIHEKVILTAARCLIGTILNDLQIRAGTNVINSNGVVVIKIKKFIIHSNFKWKTLDFDVGLIILERRLKFKIGKINKINFATNDNETIKENTFVTVSGWGFQKEDGSFTEKLIFITVPTISRNVCQKSIAEYVLTERMFCVNYLEKHVIDTCESDKGGPVVTNGVLIGINSGGVGCFQKKIYGVFTSVQGVRNWIDEILKENGFI